MFVAHPNSLHEQLSYHTRLYMVMKCMSFTLQQQVRILQCTKPYNSRNRHSVSNGLGSQGPLNPQRRGYYIGNYTVCRRIQIQGMPKVPGG